MNKVKITALKQTVYDDLIKKYENPIKHACSINVGECFISEQCEKPSGFCESAWLNIYPFVMALACGGENIYDGWMKNKKSAMISCNDGFRPMSFLIEALVNS